MAPQLEDIRKKLIEFGADPEAADKYLEKLEPQDIENLSDAALQEMAIIANFRDLSENYDKYKRERVIITMAKPLRDLLKLISRDISDPNGREYPFSYLVEDILIWVLSSPDRFTSFLLDTYDVEGVGSLEEKENQS